MTNAFKFNFSSVRRLNEGSTLKRCFYLNFLTLIKGSNNQVNELIQKTTLYKTETIEFKERLFDLFHKRTFKRCPRRFVYSLLIDRRPVFYDIHHEPFLFQRLIQNDKVHKNEESRYIVDKNRSWFPHWQGKKPKKMCIVSKFGYRVC